MKSLGQDPNALLTELKQLLQSPQAPQKSQSAKPAVNTGSFSSPIHGSWHNLGDFNQAMKRQDGRTGHSGIDMSCSAGTPVYAFGKGVVNKVGNNSIGGNVIGVQHDNGVWSYYAHLATIKVQEGDKVDQNTVVGTVGNTGNASASWPHLHFGVKVNGSWVNPAQYFSVPKYDPKFANKPDQFEKFWTSDKAKQEAEAFNIATHKKQKTRIAAPRVDALLKLASYFNKLAKE